MVWKWKNCNKSVKGHGTVDQKVGPILVDNYVCLQTLSIKR